MKLLPIRERQPHFSKFVPQLRARFLVVVVVVVDSHLCPTLQRHRWQHAKLASPPFSISQSLLKLISIESMMPSNHLILIIHRLLVATANNLTRESNLCQGQVSKFLVIFKEAQSVFGNLIEAVGKCKHFSSRAAERVKYRPGAVGGHWHLCGKNLLQSNQQKKMLMQK